MSTVKGSLDKANMDSSLYGHNPINKANMDSSLYGHSPKGPCAQ